MDRVLPNKQGQNLKMKIRRLHARCPFVSNFIIFAICSVIIITVIGQMKQSAKKEHGYSDKFVVLKRNKMDNLHMHEAAKLNQSKGLDNKTHIAFSVVSQMYAQQALVMMKSVVIFTTSPVMFHIFSDRPTIQYISQQLDKYPDKYRHMLEYKYYSLHDSFDVIKDSVADPKEFESFGPYGSIIKLLSPKLIPDIERVIFLDCDIIVFGDITRLNEQFNEFSDSHIMAMGPEGYTYHKDTNKQAFYGKHGLNNGVVLIDIQRCNAVKFVDDILKIFNEQHDLILSHHDQGLMNIYFAEKPELLHDLSCHWMFHGDIDKCSYVKSDVILRTCPEAEVHGAFLLHGTSGRFNKQSSSPQQQLHIGNYVLPPNEQREYYLLYNLVRKLDLNKPYSIGEWEKFFESAMKMRDTYCALDADWLIKQLRESIKRTFIN